MKISGSLLSWAALPALFCAFVSSFAADNLETAFLHPPDSARPGVFWFWVNGNITSNGITADLEAMSRVGIRSLILMEVSRGEPSGPVAFMSEQWRKLFSHVLAEARRLGLEVNMNNSAGWEGSGGPWIKPEESMQELVWSERDVTGPQHFEEQLLPPGDSKGFYRDVTVLAFPAADSYRIPGIELKAAYSKALVNRLRSDPGASRNDIPFRTAVPLSAVTNLSSRMDSAGRLNWDVPPGTWTILRFGHASNGVGMKPVPRSGQGLNCDKLSSAGIEANFAGMMAKLADDTGLGPAELRRSGLVATHIDSWENGAQNWTARMPEEFQLRRGYDMRPFLPVMTGRVIGSLEISERFLCDLRQTISDLVVENYAGRMRQLSAARGMRFTCEAYNGPCDDITYAGQADVPIGEFWAPDGKLMETCKGMASAAHIYGKPIVGAEAFTATARERGKEYPGSIKALGDQAFCSGINAFVFSLYTHQPWMEERCPGMAMGPFGMHYERTQTWWEWSAGWHEYLARCQVLLRQGTFVADICYLQPESPPQRVGDHPRDGYDWDECTADAVFNRMSVKDGQIVVPGGGSYRLLALPTSGTMTPQLLLKIEELVGDGATVLGPRPMKSPSLTGFPACDDRVLAVGEKLWGDCDGVHKKQNRFGRGCVVWGEKPEEWLRHSGVPPDFSCDQPARCIHRRVGDTDIYFVANPRNHTMTTRATFRIQARVPELWWPEEGRIERAPVWATQEGTTQVAICLGPQQSVFVVFRKEAVRYDPVVLVEQDGRPILSALEDKGVQSSGAQLADSSCAVSCDSAGKLSFASQRSGAYDIVSASGRSRRVAIPEVPLPLEVKGPWGVRFSPGWGAPAELTFENLISWSDHPDPGVKYFSGQATYFKTINLPRDLLSPGRRLYLDLGTVECMARVKVNGTDLGVLWKAPFRVEVTSAVRTGDNHVEINVVNLWANRQIGDEQLPEDSERLPAGPGEHQPAGLLKEWPQWLKDGKPSPTGRLTFTTWRLWRKDDPLLESGLLGPVKLCFEVVTYVN